MSEPLRALVIGCGKIGGGYNVSPDDEMVLTHALAYARHPKFHLAACVDPDAAARQEFMKKWNVAHGFASFEEAASSGIKFDVASIASPTSTHIGYLDKLLNSEVRAVFAEKPLGGDPTAAAKAVESYERAGKPLLVNYSRRFDSSMVSLRKEIEGGKWGAIDSVHVVYNRGVMNNGSHAVDLIGFLTGGKSMQLSSVGSDAVNQIVGDPTVSAVLKLSSGASFNLTGSEIQDRTVFEIELVCEKGIISIEESGLALRRSLVGEAAAFANAKPGSVERTAYGAAFTKALDAMVSALESGARPASDGRSALAAITLCDAIRRRVASAG